MNSNAAAPLHRPPTGQRHATFQVMPAALRVPVGFGTPLEFLVRIRDQRRRTRREWNRNGGTQP
jgi:hypothetical protein